MIEGINAQTAPDQRFGCEASLHPCCESQIFIDFSLALPELKVGEPEFLPRSHLLRDVRACHDPKPSAGILKYPGTADHGQTAAVFSWQNGSKTVVSIS